MPTVKQLQRLQADVHAALNGLGLGQLMGYSIQHDANVLTLKTSAANATRFRQVCPELLTALNAKSWAFTEITLTILKNVNSLNQFTQKTAWINPNLARYGKRSLPSGAQATQLQQFLQSKPAYLATAVKQSLQK